MIDLSIIVPCLDEEDNVNLVLDSLLDILSKTSIVYEIILVDDQSDDSTFSKAEQWQKKNNSINFKILYKDLERRGYGATVKYGLAYATGKYAIFVSADLVDPINLIPEMYQKSLAGADVVQCSRYLNAKDAETIPFSYKFYQVFFRIGVRICLGKKIPDSTYAFKMMDRNKIHAMGLSSNRFNISPEIMFKSILANLNVEFIPGSQSIREHGKSKFSFTKEACGYGMCLIRAFLHRYKILFWF